MDRQKIEDGIFDPESWANILSFKQVEQKK